MGREDWTSPQRACAPELVKRALDTMGGWLGSPLTTSVGDLAKGEMSKAAELEFFFKKQEDNL